MVVLATYAAHLWQASRHQLKANAFLAEFEATATLANLATHPCHSAFLWQKCLFSACHAHPAASDRDDLPAKAFQAARYLDALALHTKREPAADREPLRLYVQTSQLAAFLDTVLPAIEASRTPLVLVTGCSDFTASAEGVHHAGVAELLESPFLVRWYATNVGVRHPKLVPMPLGVDFHTLTWKQFYWLTPHTPPAAQQMELYQLHRQALSLPQPRPLRLLINFKVRSSEPSDHRTAAIRAAQANLEPDRIVHLPKVPRHRVWEAYLRVSFVVSPPGVGLDCHRTWEALILGAIPIVWHEDAMEPLYSQLPIVRVHSWSELTEANLLRWQTALQVELNAMMADPAFLSSHHWIQRILQERAA
jgi:hypothetical protein